MDGVSLLKRIDTKFLILAENLPDLLLEIKQDYYILDIQEKRLMSYTSQYFDTDSHKFYFDHHSGKIKRTKIRIRKYEDSNLYFLEIKLKDGKGNTNKSRTRISNFETRLSDSSKEFIEKITGEDYKLKTSLWNSFQRLTLVSKTAKERVTIDINLQFKIEQQRGNVDNIVIIEVKQERFDHNSTIVKALRSRGILKYGFSKYCIGMIKLYKDLKYNRFKPKLLKIKKLTS